MTRDESTQRLRWSLERLHFLFKLGAAAPHHEVEAAWEEHVQACRALGRISDGVRR